MPGDLGGLTLIHPSSSHNPVERVSLACACHIMMIAIIVIICTIEANVEFICVCVCVCRRITFGGIALRPTRIDLCVSLQFNYNNNRKKILNWNFDCCQNILSDWRNEELLYCFSCSIQVFHAAARMCKHSISSLESDTTSLSFQFLLGLFPRFMSFQASITLGWLAREEEKVRLGFNWKWLCLIKWPDTHTHTSFEWID